MWYNISNTVPEQCTDVLVKLSGGEIVKAFLNLRNTWIIENANSLNAKMIRQESLIEGWQPFPDETDPRFVTAGTGKNGKTIVPNDGEKVIILTQNGEYYIAEWSDRGNHYVLRTKEGESNWCTMAKYSVVKYMPVSEIS